MSRAGGPEWLETDERVLWHGKPVVTPRLRVRLWGTGVFYLAIVALIIPVASWRFLGFDLPFFIAGVAIVGLSVATYVPYYCRRLARTRYVLTSKRAVVIEEHGDGGDRLIWAALLSVMRWGRCPLGLPPHND